MNARFQQWSIIPCAVLTVAATASHTSLAQLTSRQTTTGRVTNLPSPSEKVSDDKAILGHYYLYRVSHDEAIKHLQNGELKQFVDAYRNMARASIEIADCISDGQERLGDAHARLEIIAAQMTHLSDHSQLDVTARRQLGEDLDTFRGMLASRLAALRERYNAVDPKDDTQKQNLRRQMAAIVGRIENFDQIRNSVEQGFNIVVPDSTTNRMKQELEDLKTALEEEEAALHLTATAMRTQIADTAIEMDRSFRLIQFQARMPNDQLRRLRELQASTNAMLNKLVTEQQRAADTVIGILSQGQDLPVPAEQDLLKHVDQLIGNN